MDENDKKEKYVVVFGGCSWEYNFKQKTNLSYNEQPDAEAPGGKGANQAVAIARAGVKVKMISKIGKDELGEKILQNLKNNNVSTEHVEIIDGIGNDYSKIYVSVNGDNDIHRFGTTIKTFDEQLILDNEKIIKGAEFVVLQSKMPIDLCFKLVDFCYKNNVKTVLTPCPSKDLKICELKNFDFLKKVTIITANESEGKDIACSDNIEEIFNKLPNLVMTAGEKGVYFSKNGVIYNIPAMKPDKIVDTTGAGDAFCGNLVASLVYQNIDTPNIKAVKTGIKASTIKIQSLGAQAGLPRKKEIFDTKYIDLHMHTNNSDGDYSVKEILQKCEETGLETIAITDHDSVQSYYDIKKQNLNFYGNIVCGIELTFKKDSRLFDILGYGIDYEKMNNWLNKQYAFEKKFKNQENILKNIVALYKKLGIEFDDNIKIIYGKKSEAYNLVKKSVLANEKNKEKFPEFWQDNFYRKYHTNPSSKYFIDETNLLPDIKNVIDAIHYCGGKAILAHSGAYNFNEQEMKTFIQYAIDNGIDGLELKHSQNDETAERIINTFVKNHNLYTTGGSDFHGYILKQNVKLGLSYGDKRIEENCAEKLLNDVSYFKKAD